MYVVGNLADGIKNIIDGFLLCPGLMMHENQHLLYQRLSEDGHLVSKQSKKLFLAAIIHQLYRNLYSGWVAYRYHGLQRWGWGYWLKPIIILEYHGLRSTKDPFPIEDDITNSHVCL